MEAHFAFLGRNPQINRTFGATAVLALAVSSSAAQFNPYTVSPGTFSASVFNSQARQILERSNQTVFGNSVEESLGKAGSRRKGAALGSQSARNLVANSKVTDAADSGSSFARAPGAAVMPSRLAANYPPASRVEAQRLFSELLDGYAKIEQQFDVPKYDVAASVAAFLAGSYMAYHNVDFPDENFKPLISQMRQVVVSNPDFLKATNAERQELYEQMAILGMFMATTQMALKEKPNPQIAANMRQAAKGYLEQFLKTDANNVEITPQGLVIR